MSTPREACWELLTKSTKHRTLTIIAPTLTIIGGGCQKDYRMQSKERPRAFSVRKISKITQVKKKWLGKN